MQHNQRYNAAAQQEEEEEEKRAFLELLLPETFTFRAPGKRYRCLEPSNSQPAVERLAQNRYGQSALELEIFYKYITFKFDFLEKFGGKKKKICKVLM